jgi:EAL domain-containing protein (putative c-di-GMP-specific phosphodiesterase class I)
MAVAAVGHGGLMVRVARDDEEKLLTRKHASPMVMRGSEIRRRLHVAAEGVATKRQLRTCIARGVEQARPTS